MSVTSAGRDLVGGGAHARAVEDVAADLAVDPARGLSPDAVTERRERHGINELEEVERPSVWAMVCPQ